MTDTAQLPRSFSEREAELRALLAKMTPGEWRLGNLEDGLREIDSPTGNWWALACVAVEVDDEPNEVGQANAAGIVALVNAAEPMLAELEALREALTWAIAEIEGRTLYRGHGDISPEQQFENALECARAALEQTND